MRQGLTQIVIEGGSRYDISMAEGFLDKKYPDLTGSKEVSRAVEQAKKDPERKFAPHARDERIEAYIGRLGAIVEDERGWELLKHKITKDLTIDTNNEETVLKIAHGLYQSEKKIAIERGHGAQIMDIDTNDDLLEKYKHAVEEKHDVQEKTLHSWLDYLEQNDASYPTWFRYFVVRNLAKMGTLDKEKGEYSKRTEYTVAPFPEINSEALGFVYRMLSTGIGHKEFAPEEQDTQEEITIKQQKRDTLQKIIDKKDFIKLYTFAQLETAGSLNRESIKGEWVKFEQGSDYHVLEDTIRGKNTGWCTAEGSAHAHLEEGDFYVYYTKGKSGNYTEPRIAIRMVGDAVQEVRGVNHRQELEPALVEIAQAQYHTLPGGEKFDKKSLDIRTMTSLVKKQEQNEPFTKDDLVFLYEIDNTIEGFGYERDPRIAELRTKRNKNEDALMVFACTSEQIATTQQEINKNTKAYVGPLFPGIFKSDIEHIYTAFPEGKLHKYNVEIGGTNEKETRKQLDAKNIYISEWGDDLLKKTSFSKNKEQAELVRLTVEALGFSNGATTNEIYKKGMEYGLELCPAEVGPALRLKTDSRDWMLIAMEQIAGRDGDPDVFRCSADGDQLELFAPAAEPTRRWNSRNRFVFRTRKSA